MRCHFLLFPPIAAKEKTTSEAILTATSKTGCSLIPGTAFCEVLEAKLKQELYYFLLPKTGESLPKKTS